jgi:peptidoglycan/LPS O-acetylase OafA/YrhL
MAIFFTLSGFLITNLLIQDRNILNFIIRRFLRIIPLAWLVLVITLITFKADTHQWLSNIFFYANWPPMGLIPAASHFWSLCVEMQFYILIAFLVSVFDRRAFIALPILCVAVTAFRAINGVEMAINSYFRMDEILAGCILAMCYNMNNASIRLFFQKLDPAFFFGLLLITSYKAFGPICYFRPYVAILVVGCTLFSEQVSWWDRILKNRFLYFTASISYALYIIHVGLIETWLGQGNTLEKYMKRPLLIGVAFALAYISTNYYEKYWIDFGKRLTQRKNSFKPIGNS